MTVNALICADEENLIGDVVEYLERYCSEHRLNCEYDCFTSGEEALNSTDIYNIAFLDVEMKNITGLEIASVLKQENKNIIIFFIAGYDTYLDDALNLSALRYLTKPLDCARFYSGLDKAIELINENVIEFYIKNSNKITRIDSNEIMYVETLAHKTKIVTEKQLFYSSEQLSYWESKLNHSCFCRVHKSFLLNMDYVVEYQRREVKLPNGEIVPISYRRQAEFRKEFLDYSKVIK